MFDLTEFQRRTTLRHTTFVRCNNCLTIKSRDLRFDQNRRPGPMLVRASRVALVGIAAAEAFPPHALQLRASPSQRGLHAVSMLTGFDQNLINS